ncbi:hypothetical protein AB4454_17115, partial [Vibrio artabrorum]|uniref:hypothetical protein n=1 Tax=Vibrio artabrorum TaxID=446374 RepID=UPI00354FC926
RSEGVLIDLAASRAKASKAFLSILLILSHDWLNYKQIHNLNYRLTKPDMKNPSSIAGFFMSGLFIFHVGESINYFEFRATS